MRAARAVLVEDPAREVALEVLVVGEAPSVVLVPSAMRGAADFGELQAALLAAGHASAAINPRGAGRSRGAIEGLTLRDLADDVALVADRLCGGAAHLIGHALGNIFVRAAASYRPEAALSVSVMPCGGHNLGSHPAPPEVIAAIGRCHDESLPEAERLEALRTAFFAPGNDPSVWLEGWWPQSAGLASAIGRADPEEWWRAGTAPLLIVQPMNDPMCAPEVELTAAATIGPRARYVEVPDCSHAILPEQPRAVARAVIDFLDDL